MGVKNNDPPGADAASSAPPRRGVYILPNLITTAGLFSGFYSIICAFHADFFSAAVAILVANIFDGLDGRIARLTHSTSRFGIEYDSLSDVIAFGVAPGILVYRWALEPWGSWGWLAASLYVACGALRLARFNVQYENVEKRNFIGLPIPAAAEVIAATVLLYYRFGGEGETHTHALILLMTYALAGLMVSNLKFYSGKDINLRKSVSFSVVVGITFGLVALFMVSSTLPEMLFLLFLGYGLSGYVIWAYEFVKRKGHGRAPPPPPAGA